MINKLAVFVGDAILLLSSTSSNSLDCYCALLNLKNRVKLRTFIVVSNSGTKGATKSQMESVLPSQSPVPLDPANLFGLLNLNNFKADININAPLYSYAINGLVGIYHRQRDIFSAPQDSRPARPTVRWADVHLPSLQRSHRASFTVGPRVRTSFHVPQQILG